MQPRPPMPWFGLRDMNDADLKAIYAFIRAAGRPGSRRRRTSRRASRCRDR